MKEIIETVKLDKRDEVKWMNPVAIGRAAYEPTNVEHIANIISHGVFVGPACYLSLILYEASQSWSGSAHNKEEPPSDASVRSIACTIYGISLVLLFSISTLFHIVCYTGQGSVLRHLLHRADRAMIYLFIASSYTPWLLLKPIPLESWTVHLRWGIWVLAVVGILYQQIFHEMFKMIDTIFYITIGLMPSLAVVEMNDDLGLSELKYGGAVYLIGVIFFKLDGRLPFAHAIWHLFVVIGSYIHYVAVSTYLMAPAAVHLSHIDSSDYCASNADGLCSA